MQTAKVRNWPQSAKRVNIQIDDLRHNPYVQILSFDDENGQPVLLRDLIVRLHKNYLAH